MTRQLVYKGVAVHYLCYIHGLKNGQVPDPKGINWQQGVCTVCQVDGPQDQEIDVAPPEAWGGMREINSGNATGFEYIET